MQNYKIKAGEVIHFTSGAYSDYGLVCDLVFRKDCDLESVAIEFARDVKEKYRAVEYDSPDPEEFAAWLVINGWAVDFGSREMHIGEYGRFEVGNVSLGCDVDDWPS